MINKKMDAMLSFYTCPGALTDAGGYSSLLADLPDDVSALVQTVQGLVMHVFWTDRYGVSLSEESQTALQIHRVEAKLAHLLAIDPRPLTVARPLELRMIGNCRDFSQILAVFMRAKGIPARARCGFGTYFIPGHFEDHWMTEYWHSGEGRWVQVDAQLDELQRKALEIQFDTLDMPAGQFVLAGAAWQMCRAGQANPDNFGILDYKGWDFIKWNLLRDLLSLNKIEPLPWDLWGTYDTPYAESSPEQLAKIDQIAALSLAGNESFDAQRSFYEEDKGLHFPEAWLT